jgi:hypothetical protein
MIPADDNDDREKSDGEVVPFPKTAEERKALRKAKQEQEKQRLINVFIDEAGGEQALFHTADQIAYADVIIDGHRETWPIRSKQFRYAYMRYLRRQLDCLLVTDAALAATMKFNKSAISAAIDDFEARAITSPITREVHVRVAGLHGGNIYLDLGTSTWEAVRITSASWSIVESPPVRFKRTPGMLPLPMPVRGGNIEALRPFLNTTAYDFTLVVAFLLACLYPRGPYPILILYGEQGAAKTNFLRTLRKLIDPNEVTTSALPLNARDLFIAAGNIHLQTFENVSKLSDAMSDNFCRLATGGGLRVRTLFRNTDETLFRGARPIAFEGIVNVVTRADLQDRALIFELPNISQYRTEQALQAEFECQLPGIFGGLLTMLARGLERLPATRLVNRPPRMADFALWAAACGLEDFEAAYAANRQNAINVMLSHDLIAKEVRRLLAKRKAWTGTMDDLLDIVGPVTGIKATKKLSDELRRLAPMLRSVGIQVVYEQRTAAQRPIRITRE